MKITAEKRQEIITKTLKIEEAEKILKSEFVGLDSIIQQLMESIKPYYLFSEYLKKPLVINLWGLTGTGKTSIINRLCTLLDIGNKLYKFDCGEYVGSDYKLKYEIDEKISHVLDKNIVFLFDEFQLCRTIAEDGKETDRIGLRPLWELIDSGTANTYSKKNYGDLKELYSVINKLSSTEIEIDHNGLIVIGQNIYNTFTLKNYYSRFCDFDGLAEHENVYEYTKEVVVDRIENKQEYFIKYSWIKTLLKSNRSYFSNLSDEEVEVLLFADTKSSLEIVSIDKFNLLLEKTRLHFNNKSIAEIREIIKYNFLLHEDSAVKLDFSKSLIFCIGNLDEAYSNIVGDLNPDMDADYLHRISLKITIPEIKEALSVRFRKEQISRLGNNHIIYPSLSKDNYKDIIKMYLKQRVNQFKTDYLIDFEFTPQVNELIYKESVYPTQGVRPVLSTINSKIDSYVGKIISDSLIETNIDFTEINRIVWNFNKKKVQYEIDLLNQDNLILRKNYPVVLTIENLRKTDFSDEQVHTAVHESGHAIIALYELGLIPTEIVSKTADSESAGFCLVELPSIRTKELMEKQIMLSYGGIVAESILFGEEKISTGASSDIAKATNLISAYFKLYGMSDVFLNVSSITDVDHFGNKFLLDKNYDKHIKQLSNQLKKRTFDVINSHKEELLKLSYVLSKKSKIVSKDVIKILNLKPADFRKKEEYYTFKTTLVELMSNKIK